MFRGSLVSSPFIGTDRTVLFEALPVLSGNSSRVRNEHSSRSVITIDRCQIPRLFCRQRKGKKESCIAIA